MLDSLLVEQDYLGRRLALLLFVVPWPGCVLGDALKAPIKEQVRTHASARHVPDEIVAIEEVPRTLTGKKRELRLRKLLLGMPRERWQARMRRPIRPVWGPSSSLRDHPRSTPATRDLHDAGQ